MAIINKFVLLFFISQITFKYLTLRFNFYCLHHHNTNRQQQDSPSSHY